MKPCPGSWVSRTFTNPSPGARQGFWALAGMGHSPLSEAPACLVLYSLPCPQVLQSLTARCNNPPPPCSGIGVLISPAFTPYF